MTGRPCSGSARQPNRVTQRPQVILGLMYVEGMGVPQDDREAVQWYRKAATQDNAIAQYNLGFMYAFGRGVPQDDGEGVQWYRKAAMQDNALAQNNLGFMYAEGRVCRKMTGRPCSGTARQPNRDWLKPKLS